ncbi:MAG: hypothetical protein VX733_11450 [Candidatus Latescibacterota bacterium]|nr:hypothetical protein [Candidatus Latescibacterota bacterium]
MKDAYLEIARRILPLPTAPGQEHHVVREIAALASTEALPLSVDPFGNLTLRTPALAKGEPAPITLTAHLDHPGLGLSAVEPSGELLFRPFGNMPVEMAVGRELLLFTSQGDSKSPIARCTAVAYRERGVAGPFGEGPGFVGRLSEGNPHTFDLAHTFAMWDLPPLNRRGRRLVGRACDDLAGVAVALTTLVEVTRRQPAEKLAVFLTRAEETGFGGILAAVQNGLLSDESLYLNIECSSCRAGAPLGDGPIIRVGDRRWIFDADITEGLVVAARQCHRDGQGSQPLQRKLMDAGACEATVLARAGLRVGAVALPLDNYHNQGRHDLQPEAVNIDDAVGLVRILFYLGTAQGDPPIRTAIRELDGLLGERRHLHERALERSAGAIRDITRRVQH